MKNIKITSVMIMLILVMSNICVAENEKNYINIGRAHLEEGKYQQAIENLKKAVELNSQSPEAHSWLGLAYKGSKLYDEAIEEFTKMLSLDPGLTELYYMGVGDAYLGKGLDDKAIEAYEKLISIAPMSETYKILGNIYYRKEFLNKAADYFLEAIKIDPNDYTTHFKIALIYFEQKLYNKAIEECKKAIELNPNMAAAHRALGGAYGDIGKYKEAEIEIQEASRLEPDNLEYHFALGLTYVSLGRWKEALSKYLLLKSTASHEGYDPEVLKSVIIFGRIFGVDVADTKGGLVINIPLDEPLPEEELKQLMGYLDRAKQSNDLEAVEILKESLNVKETISAHYSLGDIYLKTGDCEEAINHLERAKELKKENGFIYVALSRAYTHCKGRQNGLNILEEFLQRHPEDKLVICQLANMYFGYGDWENSIKMLEKIKNLDEIIFTLMEDNYKIAKEKVINKK